MSLGTTPESKAMSKDMKKRGWSFVGPTTAYAAMEAMGLVNDHIEGCAIRSQVESDRSNFVRPTRRTRVGEGK
jgi:DNA-3-methyladenine glycosylase I